MAALVSLGALVLGWLAYLAVERVRLDHHRAAIPLRIAVTGTRGKTTVARQLAAVLSQDGRRVLTKTTGAEATYLFPDGSSQEIHRIGTPSIIEQKRLLKLGAKMGVDAVVAEVMSVHPENHRVELQEILQPQLVLLTNFRVDHMEAQGKSRGEVASVLALDVPLGARVLVPEEELEPRFLEAVSATGGRVEPVPHGSGGSKEGSGISASPGGFGPNLDLVCAAARNLGVGEEAVQVGLGQAQGDVGALKSWRYGEGGGGEAWILVNAFAANDPESTLRIYDGIADQEAVPPEACVGLLSLRSDRGDRTEQWAEALGGGGLGRFRCLFLAGLHSRALRHRLRKHPEVGRIRILRNVPPEEVMAQVLSGAGTEKAMLFGFGNIYGLGRSLVRYWQKVGTENGL